MISSCDLILALLSFDKVGPSRVATRAKLYNYNFDKIFKSLELDFAGKKDELKSALINAKKTIQKNINKGIKCICLLDKEFPKKLCESSDPVVFLYYKGDINLLNQKGITIIGTREPHNNFIKEGKNVSEYFAKKGYVIVSGLAIGCDTIAHNAALKYTGKTIATLPSSIDNILPISNLRLSKEIVDRGGLLISEYSTGAPFNKFNYAQRDRIQSLLTNVAIVIESTNDGGSMIAVNKSIKDDKKVYALKGNNLYKVKNYIDSNSVVELSKIEKNL